MKKGNFALSLIYDISLFDFTLFPAHILLNPVLLKKLLTQNLPPSYNIIFSVQQSG